MLGDIHDTSLIMALFLHYQCFRGGGGKKGGKRGGKRGIVLVRMEFVFTSVTKTLKTNRPPVNKLKYSMMSNRYIARSQQHGIIFLLTLICWREIYNLDIILMTTRENAAYNKLLQNNPPSAKSLEWSWAFNPYKWIQPAFTFLFLSPPSSKCLHLFRAICFLYLQSVHSIRRTIFFVVLALKIREII